MKKILLIPLFLLTSCAGVNGLTNEEIVKQVKFCEENGLDPISLVNGLGVVGKIQCSINKSNDN